MDEILIEEKPGIGERVLDFLGDHPLVAGGLYTMGCVGISITITLLFGRTIGRAAGQEMGKMLIEAGLIKI